MATMSKRTTPEKIELFRRCVHGRTDVYGTYDPDTGRVRLVKAPVTDRVIVDHLAGRQPFGVFLLVDDKTHALAVDFDAEELTGPVAFVGSARHYGLAAYIERSKCKGYHVWLFFHGAVSAQKARRVTRHILEEIGQGTTEIFPKQDRLDRRTGYGNFINAPLFGRLVPQGRTVFVDPGDPTKPCPDPWELLANIQRVPESMLDAIIEINQLDEQTPETIATQHEAMDEKEFHCGLAPCARRILAEGVTDFQRVTCFRLAVQLHRLGLPLDVAVGALQVWAGKNRPVAPKRQIAEREIETQAADAYAKGYKGFGCTEPAIAAFCDPKCPISKKGALPES